MLVEFVVGSCPCTKGFSPGSLVFLPPQKPTFPTSNSTWIEDLMKTSNNIADHDVASSLNTAIYLILPIF